MAFLQAAANRQSGDYQIKNSLKLENDNAEGLTRNYSGDGDRKTWTFSGWVKRTELGVEQYIFAAGHSAIKFLSNNLLRVQLYDGSATRYADLNRVFRDTAAWYHIVVAVDSTQGTAANRVKIYINGVQNTSFNNSTYTNMSQNDEFGFGEASSNWQVGYNFAGGSNFMGFCGYIAEFHYTDGVANAATAFGKVNDVGEWIPTGYGGSYGNKGIYMSFGNSANLGFSSITGSFALANITAIDQATDTPTNNFAVGNPLNTNPPGIFSQGATRWVSNNGTGMNGAWNLATIAMPAGKWHCEVKCISTTNTHYQWGISPTHPNDSFASRLMYRSDGAIYNAGSGGNTTGHASYGAGDIIGMSYDEGANTVIFSKNGTAIVTKTALARNSAVVKNEPYFFGGTGLSSGTYTGDFNFGGYANYAISSAATDANGYGTFEYAPPSGYYALCTKNLAELGG